VEQSQANRDWEPEPAKAGVERSGRGNYVS
jgi:hypothetical protein